jgi:hypothetical protein
MQLCHEALYHDTAFHASRPPFLKHIVACYHDIAIWEPVSWVYGCVRLEAPSSIDGRDYAFCYCAMDAGFGGWLEQVVARLSGAETPSQTA